MVLICFIVVGYFFSLDNPAELEQYLVEELSISYSKYSLLYSLYSFPNMLIPFIGGMALDKIGLSNGLVITSGLVTLG